MLAHLFFLLLSVFAVLTVSVAYSQALPANHDVRPHLATNGTAPSADDLLVLFSDDDDRLALVESDGTDDFPAPRIGEGLPATTINPIFVPAGAYFNFLRGRTSAPRAPPAQV